jgi:hypothetical protein
MPVKLATTVKKIQGVPNSNNSSLLAEFYNYLNSIGVSEIFLGQVGRLNEDRFLRYYCNKCQREYKGSPKVEYETPNEELGEDVILVERGEYKCNTCNNILAQYRKFNK